MLYGPVYFLEHLRACPIVGVLSLVLEVPGHTIHLSPSDAFRLIKAEPLYCDGDEAASGFLFCKINSWWKSNTA